MAFNCVVEAMRNLTLTLGGLTQKVDTLQLLHDQGNKICGSGGNWILMFNHYTYNITLFNLWTKAIVNIPPIPYLTADENRVIHKAVFSSRFSGTSCYNNVTVIYGEEKELASYNLGTKRWGLLKTAGTGYEDVICHLEEFYAVDVHGKVVHYRFDDGCYGRKLVNQWRFFGQKVYLVVVEGDLFMIIRHVSSSDHSDTCSQTNLFEVYVLKGCGFEEAAGLKEWAILLTENQAVAVLARKSQGLRASCIYFRDDCNHLNDREMRAFDMEEKYVEVMQGGDADKLNRLWEELYLNL